MEKIYLALVQKGIKSIDDVPPHLKKQVEQLLAALTANPLGPHEGR